MEISSDTSEVMNHDLLTRTYFNNLADSWESKQSQETQKIEKLLSLLNLRNKHKILDIGCGTGVLFPVFEKLTVGQSKIYAIDFAECMTSSAAANRNGFIEVVCGDSQSLPFRENYFDLVVAFHVIPHIKEKSIALHEFWRVLRPAGEMAIIHLKGSKALNMFHAELGGPVANHKLPSANELSKCLCDIGFHVSNSIDIDKEYFVRAIKPGKNWR